MARQRQSSREPNQLFQPHPPARSIDPLTAVGVLLVLVSATALITYAVLIVPGRLAAAGGPPESFRAAATLQSQLTRTLEPSPVAITGTSPSPTVTASLLTTTSTEATTIPSLTSESSASDSGNAIPTSNPHGDWPLPSWVEPRYWISIPALNVEAPVIALAPRLVEEQGAMVWRLPVPNSYSVAWDETSAEPGFTGNVIMTGHNNLYGAVFGDLDKLSYGDEIAIWSEYGVFSYYVSAIEYLEYKDQPLEVRTSYTQWLSQTFDQRLTLISCWPRQTATHRIIIVATR
jgi:sortase A